MTDYQFLAILLTISLWGFLNLMVVGAVYDKLSSRDKVDSDEQ